MNGGEDMTRLFGKAPAFFMAICVWMSVTDVNAETARYDVDPDHSTIGFSVDHMVVSKTRGQFMEYTGFIEMDPDAKTVKTIEAMIKTPSITTNHPKRDTHLKSPEFFDVEKYPTMTYKMKSYHKTGDGYTAIGDLTLHGVTKEITLVGNFNGVNKDPWGNMRAGFTAEGKVNRKDFGVNWNKALDNGGVIVGNEVLMKLDVECIKAK
jgi:polyisoprenoid-binding protein YceI